MKKNIFAFAAILATVAFAASCSKVAEPSEPVESGVTVKTLTVQASLKGGVGEGMKTAIAADDILRIRFSDASGAKVGRTQVLYNTSGAGTSASFSAEGIAVPDNAATVVAFLDNKTTGAVNYASAPTVDDFTTQNGTLAGAQARQIIMGESSLSGSDASVTLDYKTTILKAVVSYPEGVKPVAGSTDVTLSCGQYSKVGIDLGLNSDSTKGDITVPATVQGDQAVAYIAVWAAGLTEGSLFSNIQTTKYGCDFDAEGIGAGTTCVSESTVETLVYTVYVEADGIEISGVRGNKVSGPDWVSFSNGTITVQANKTGALRSGSLVLDNGKVYIFNQQMGPEAYLGDWTLYTKLFDPNKTIKKGNVGAYKAPVTFTAAKGENGNNIKISGFYLDAEVEGKVTADFETGEVKIGVYVSTNRIYDAGNGKYCVLLPECAAVSGYWTGYNFCPKTDGAYSDSNYDWLWFTVNSDGVAKYQYYGAGQISANGKYKYCGLSFVVASATAVTGSSYDVIFQANYNGSNAESQYFKR